MLPKYFPIHNKKTKSLKQLYAINSVVLYDYEFNEKPQMMIKVSKYALIA